MPDIDTRLVIQIPEVTRDLFRAETQRRGTSMTFVLLKFIETWLRDEMVVKKKAKK